MNFELQRFEFSGSTVHSFNLSLILNRGRRLGDELEDGVA